MPTQEFIDPDLTGSDRSSDAGESSVRRASVTASPSRAEIDARVEQARQQMLALRHQQEELERQRQELEELRMREEEFERGKHEMLEVLSKTITKIEQEEFETNKRVTLLSGFRESYQQFFNQIQDLREDEWSADEIKAQLPKAVSVLEASRAELNKGRAQLNFLEEEGALPRPETSSSTASFAALSSSPEPSAFDFITELKRGFAFSLPLLVVGIFIWIALLAHGH